MSQDELIRPDVELVHVSPTELQQDVSFELSPTKSKTNILLFSELKNILFSQNVVQSFESPSYSDLPLVVSAGLRDASLKCLQKTFHPSLVLSPVD